MTKIAWVTDSMAYFTKEEAEAIGVNVVPIQILLGIKRMPLRSSVCFVPWMRTKS